MAINSTVKENPFTTKSLGSATIPTVYQHQEFELTVNIYSSIIYVKSIVVNVVDRDANPNGWTPKPPTTLGGNKFNLGPAAQLRGKSLEVVVSVTKTPAIVLPVGHNGNYVSPQEFKVDHVLTCLDNGYILQEDLKVAGLFPKSPTEIFNSEVIID